MGLAVRIDDGVPDDCLRRRSAGGGVGGGICGGYPDEQLLGVPIEEGCEV